MRHSRKKIQIFPVIIWTVLFVWTLVFLALIAWAFITSLKTVFNFYQDPIGLPQEKYGGWQFENYVNAFNAIKINKNGIWIGVPGLFKNSMLFVLGNATLSVLTACIASYVLEVNIDSGVKPGDKADDIDDDSSHEYVMKVLG